MRVLTKRTCMSLLVVFLIGRPAFAQEWTDWAADSDGALIFEEFSQSLASRKSLASRISSAARNTDGNGKLAEQELGTGIFNRNDQDRTQVIEETEIAELDADFGTDRLWEAEDAARIKAVDSETTADAPHDIVTPDEAVDVERTELPNWDIDGDGLIVTQEFKDGFRDWGTFDEFDADGDGGITGDELAQEIFALLRQGRKRQHCRARTGRAERRPGRWGLMGHLSQPLRNGRRGMRATLLFGMAVRARSSEGATVWSPVPPHNRRGTPSHSALGRAPDAH